MGSDVGYLSIWKWHVFLSYWLSKIDVVSFAAPVHEHSSSWGLSSLRVKFFPKPSLPTVQKKGPPYTAFFWQRQVDIDLNFVAKLFPPGLINKVFFKRDVAGYHTDKLPFEVVEMPMWSSKQGLYDAIQQADYYVAPRSREGIGFGFLEAMSLGRVVVASNEHTMTEYVQEGVTGHLFDMKGRLSEKWVAPEVIQENLPSYCHDLHQGWLKDKERIKEFLTR